ncbi:MAG: mechanosensitive ion channel domain-containing protein [Lentisphaeria bacterium]
MQPFPRSLPAAPAAPAPRRAAAAARFLLLCGTATLLLAGSQAAEFTRPAGPDAALAQVQTQITGALHEQAATRGRLLPAVKSLEAEAAAARQDQAARQDELVGALAGSDPLLLEAVQAEIRAQQARQTAADEARALALKKIEETGREVESQKRRLASLELARRLEVRVLLASAAEVAARDKKVENARTELAVQKAQVRKCQARWENAVFRGRLLQRQLCALPPPPPAEKAGRLAEGGTAARLAAARAEERRWLERQLATGQEAFLFNRQLDLRARRNLAFARQDLLVQEAYAAALGRKAAKLRAAELQALADAADATLGTARAAVEERQKTAAQEQLLAAKAVDAALAALGHAHGGPEQEAAKAAYELAEAQKSRWDAELELLKEWLACQKAVAAFAGERFDRAADAAADKSLEETGADRRALAESALSSVQYVASFKTLLQKLDGTVEGLRAELGMAPESLQAALRELDEWTLRQAAEKPAATPPFLARLLATADRLAEAPAGPPPPASAAAALAKARRQAVAAQLLCRAAQRTLTRERLAIAERWLEHTQAAIQATDRQAAALLWKPEDPRLGWGTAALLGDSLAAAGADAVFTWHSYRLGRWRDAGVASPLRLGLAASVLLLVATAGSVLGHRWQRRGGAVAWAGAQALRWTVPCLAAAGLLARLFPAHPAARLAAAGLAGAGAWHLLRCLLCAGFPGRTFPGRQTLAGGMLLALRLLAASGIAALALTLFTAGMEGTEEMHALLFRAWGFFAWLAFFRLALHPLLLGRFLSRRSESRLRRVFGTGVAAACILAVGLAVIPWLASLDSLGEKVFQITAASLGLLGAGAAGTALVKWLFRRAGEAATLWRRPVQTAVAAAAAAVALWLWWRLLADILLSPAAPAAVQDAVQAAQQAGQRWLRLWNHAIGAGMTIGSVSKGLLAFAASFWLATAAKRLFLERVLARTPMDDTTRQTFVTILGYLVILGGFLVGLNVAGSSLKNLALLAGAITVGLGFGLQNVINNFVSSLLIHFGRTVRVGDYIDVGGGTRGVVREIGLRQTMISTEDGVTVLIPNGAFITANVVNWTNPSRATRLHLPLALPRTADLASASQLLVETALANPLVLRQPAPSVEVRAVAADQIALELLAWTEKPERQAALLGELGLAADQRLRARGLLA